MPGEEEIEAGLEDGLVRRARMRVGEGVASVVDLGEEAPRHGDVHSTTVLVERDDHGGGCGTHPKEWFMWLNHDRSVVIRGYGCPGRARSGDRRHNVAKRRPIDRANRRHNLGGLAPREVEESRQDVGQVAGLGHLRQLDDGRQAQAPIAEGCHKLRMLPHELRSHLPVVGRALGESELAVQEPEEARVP